MGKLRLKHMKQIVQGPMANEWWSQDLNVRSLIPKIVLLNMMMSPMKPLWCVQIEIEIEIIQKGNRNYIVTIYSQDNSHRTPFGT